MANDPVARWVGQLNKMALEMDEIAYATHPSAWHELLAPYRAKYEKLARSGPGAKTKPGRRRASRARPTVDDRAEQLRLF